MKYGYLKFLAKIGVSFGKLGSLKIPIYTKTWKYLYKEIFIDEIYYFDTKNKSPFILDCGANIGYSILYFKYLYPDAKILSFEAASETYEKLMRTMEANAFTDVTIERMALSDEKDTKVRFFKNASDGCDLGASLNSRGVGNYEEVIATKLSLFLNGEVDYIKIDIEGAETRVLRDLVNSKKLDLIKEGLIEFHLDDTNLENSLSFILDTLISHNFVYRFVECDKINGEWPKQQAILIRFKQKS